MQNDAILQKGTVSFQNTILQVQDTQIPVNFKRHLAPRTVRIMLQSLPIQGNAHRTDDMIYINTEIDSGRERTREKFKSGDVAFLSNQRCLCFFTRDCTPTAKMTPIGTIQDDTNVLQNVRAGDVFKIYELR